jgi:hypothetical protein
MHALLKQLWFRYLECASECYAFRSDRFLQALDTVTLWSARHATADCVLDL